MLLGHISSGYLQAPQPDWCAGVFANQDIACGTVIETAHCIKLSAQEYHEHGR